MAHVWQSSPPSSPSQPSQRHTDTERILSFYDYTQGKDFLGRTLEDYLSWTNSQIEHNQSFFWKALFPIPERSNSCPLAPVVTEEVFDAFRAPTLQGDHLRYNLGRAVLRIVRYLGFKQHPERAEIYFVMTNNAGFGAQGWLNRYDHNHRHISRVLRSLRVLGDDGDAGALFLAVLQVFIALYPNETGHPAEGYIESEALVHWAHAARRPLHFGLNQPDHDAEDNCVQWIRCRV
ncbi:MAG: hypothetical protein M1819_007008 [Sarea resinae]|nr:MAG: hypothetical protein M1819_007008 [Sarea resinae]